MQPRGDISEPTHWQVIVKYETPRLLIIGKYHQEFEIMPGSNAEWMADMLRRAIRRIAPDTEKKSKSRKQKPSKRGKCCMTACICATHRLPHPHCSSSIKNSKSSM